MDHSRAATIDKPAPLCYNIFYRVGGTPRGFARSGACPHCIRKVGGAVDRGGLENR